MGLRGSATDDNEAQPRQRADARELRKSRAVVEVGEDTRDAHLHNGECLVVQQLLLPQVIIQCRSILPSVVSDPIGGGGGGYLLRDLEPLKIVFDEGFEDEWPQLETSGAGEPVEGHDGGWASGNKRRGGRVSGDVQWLLSSNPSANGRICGPDGCFEVCRISKNLHRF